MAKKNNELAVRNELPVVRQEFIDEIQTLHNEIQGHIKMTVEKAVRLGELLIAVKEMLPHGEFGKWIDEFCGFSDRTARKYMQIYHKMDEMKTAQCADLSSMFRLLNPSNDDADSDVVQIIEADEVKEIRDLNSRIEGLEATIATLNKANQSKQKSIDKLQDEVNKSESLDNESPEKLLAYKKIADAGGDPENDSKETAYLINQITVSRKYFRDHALQLQAAYIPEIAKETLKKEVVSLLRVIAGWTNTVASQFDITQEDL